MSLRAVAAATIEAIEQNAFEVIRGGEARAKMIALNRDDPAALDKRFLDLKPALAEAVRDHSSALRCGNGLFAQGRQLSSEREKELGR